MNGKQIIIIGKGHSINQVDFNRVKIPILSINFSYPNYDYMVAYDYDASIYTGGIYIKTFYLQDQPCFDKRKTRHLGFYNFTVTAAVNWCYKKGFNKIYLAGIDHETGHYKDKLVQEFIEQFVGKIKIYQCNQNSTWNLPKTKRFLQQ